MEKKDIAGDPVKQLKSVRDEDNRVIARLVKDRVNPRPRSSDKLDLAPLGRVFRRTVQDVSDIRNIFQIIPELKLNRDILVSAVVAPGDLSTTTLNISGHVKGADASLTAQLSDALDQFFVVENKMASKVPTWIEDALVMSGAHPILILPEASIDRIIQNGVDTTSMESVSKFAGEFEHDWFKPKGMLGIPMSRGDRKVEYVSFESNRMRLTPSQMPEYHTIKMGAAASKEIKLPIRVTDNLAALRLPAVQQVKRGQAYERAYGTPSLEARRRERKSAEAKNAEEESRIGSAEVYSKFFKQPQAIRRSRLVVVPSGHQIAKDRVGHPLEYHLATESVMPVTVPGDESNHVGYFIFLDGNGYPISSVRKLNYYSDLRKGSSGSELAGSEDGMSGELINMSKEAITGGLRNATDEQLDNIAELNGSIIEADLIARLKAGMMGGEFELSRTNHINMMLLARTCRNQQTTILYVPADLMIYMAYEYNEYGVGKSILEDAKTQAAIHSALTVADAIGSVKNAIPGKNINIKLDADDKDPLQSATWMAQEALGLAYRRFPMTISSPMGTAEELQMSAMSINISGNPLFPEIETTVTPKESSYTPIEPETIKRSRDALTRVFSQTPEMVDGMNNADFATTVLANNHMLLKRVMLLQDETNPQLSEYVRIFTHNSGILTDQLLAIINENLKMLPKEFEGEPEKFLKEFLDQVHVTLPAPETENLSKQLEMFDRFSMSLDKAIEAYLKEEYFDGYDPDMYREAIPTAIAALKGKIQRDWMRKRGILRELDIFGKGEDGKALMDISEEMANHVEALKGALGEYLKLTLKDATARKERKRQEDIRKLMDEANAAKEAGGAVPPADDGTGGDAGNEFASPNADDPEASGIVNPDEEQQPEEQQQEEEQPQEEEQQEEEQPEEEETPAQPEANPEGEEEGGEDGSEPGPIKF